MSADEPESLEEIAIDVEALTRRYAEERDKRLRADGVSQYQPLQGEFAHLAADPNADPGLQREPVVTDADVLIIGGGFSGLLAGARLRQQGVADIRIVERGADFGGTWYWNRYPGAACDVESYIYLPMLEETGYTPTQKYVTAPEIYEHCRRIGRHFRLYDGALFQTDVTAVTWDEERSRWTVVTNRGDRIAARFVVSCKGLFTNPKLPKIHGIESFQGHSFHTSRWDYGYTGGRETGELTGLVGKRVGVIGTGSTGIQCIPPLADWARHLYVFQRTPASIDVRGNTPTDADWWAGLEPGWQRKRMDNFTLVTSGIPQPVDMIDDAWTAILRDVPAPTGGEGKQAADPVALQNAQIKKMEMVRRRIRRIVKDERTAEALEPYYHYFCKRPGFSDNYLETFNRPNVTLVDTAGQGVDRVTPGGVVAGGREYELDCLIYATGFDFMTEYTREAGFEIYGRDGAPLSQRWSRGARTLFGIHAHGYPNLFVISLVQAGISINYIHIVDVQTQHVAYVIGRCLHQNTVAVEPTREAEEEWVQAIVDQSGPRRAFLAACIPGYYNYEGRRDEAFELNEPYGGGATAYIELLEAWRAEGAMKGLATTQR